MQDMIVVQMQCNHMECPLGIEKIPMLSWKLQSDFQGDMQQAYRIVAAHSIEELENGEWLWDSGVRESGETFEIPYGGPPLSSRERVYWKVWNRTNAGEVWSASSFWEMGLLSQKDWKAMWITDKIYPVGINGAKDDTPATILRKTFDLKNNVKKARVYLCGLGYYELFINGKRVGDRLLDPAYTCYDQRVLYQTYDVTDMLQKGENAVAARLGEGWYNCTTPDVWYFKQASWRDTTKLIMQMEVYDENEESICITSGTDWKISNGKVRFNALRSGEVIDASLEPDGWKKAGFDDSEWGTPVPARAPGGLLHAQQIEPIRLVERLEPVAHWKTKHGRFVYDFGRNTTGWAEVCASGAQGSAVVVRYGEILDAEGNVDQNNLNIYVSGQEFQTDRFYLAGADEETFAPHFTYHGFRYAEVELEGNVELKDIQCCVVHTDLHRRGNFECSNELLNEVNKCACNSLLTNYHGIPTDCPHREKNGWTGDAMFSCDALLYNFAPMVAYEKWMDDFGDVLLPSGHLPGIIPTSGWGYTSGSGTAWDSAAILIPWNCYVYDGNLSLLKKMYPLMQKVMAYNSSMADGYIVSHGLGDHSMPAGGERRVPFMETCYLHTSAITMEKIARVLKKRKDQQMYKALAKNIRQALANAFVDSETGIVGAGTQAELACALYHGIVSGQLARRVAKRLAERVEADGRMIQGGIMTAKALLRVLCDYGYEELAYSVASRDEYPGWGYMARKGDMTLWEGWEDRDSHNHHLFSDISAWFYSYLGGIKPDEETPGFHHFEIKPYFPEQLSWVNVSFDSVSGMISNHWRRIVTGIEMCVYIPANTTATVCPVGYEIISLSEGVDGHAQELQPTNTLKLLAGQYKIQLRKMNGR